MCSELCSREARNELPDKGGLGGLDRRGGGARSGREQCGATGAEPARVRVVRMTLRIASAQKLPQVLHFIVELAPPYLPARE